MNEFTAIVGDAEEPPRPGDPDAADAQVDTADDEDAAVAECAPPQYDEGSDPHNGKLDGFGRSEVE